MLDGLDNSVQSLLALFILDYLHMGDIVRLVFGHPARQVFKDKGCRGVWTGFLCIGQRGCKLDGVYAVVDLGNVARMEPLVNILKGKHQLLNPMRKGGVAFIEAI